MLQVAIWMSFLKRPSENYCPGISDYVRPTVGYKKCEECGGRVEFWSDEVEGVCLDCGAKHRKKEETSSDAWGPNRVFRFPARGGTGAIWQWLADSLAPERLHFGAQAVRVDLDRRTVHFADGGSEAYDRLVTSPL